MPPAWSVAVTLRATEPGRVGVPEMTTGPPGAVWVTAESGRERAGDGECERDDSVAACRGNGLGVPYSSLSIGQPRIA